MKKFLRILFFFLVFFSFVGKAQAQEDFSSKTHIIYEVNPLGVTYATHEVSVRNLTTDVYLKEFVLELSGVEVTNPKATSNGGVVDLQVNKEPDKSVLLASFSEPIVGKGEIRPFLISYEDHDAVVRTGEVWEITLPKLDADSYGEFEIELKVPRSFGANSYVSPEPVRTETTERFYIFYFDSQVGQSGITAAFGQFQSFQFDLTYHLENPVNRESEIEIAIPPDTAFQKVYYDELEPKPETVSIDKDGNWLAVYKLGSRQRVDVVVRGMVRIIAAPNTAQKFGSGSPEDYLGETIYWQVSDEKIQDAAKNLHTAEDVYNFVVSHLSYNYDRVKPNIQREGALYALENPDEAICMEFTDLFVAIARAIGIPAREVNGYAYTDNPTLQPLSLVADVLHAWPEYWDSDRKVWVGVDPTWGDTTGGIDFFSKLDLRHFAFVIHGSQPDRPYPPGSYKLGANPQKDVHVSLSQLPDTKAGDITAIALESRKLGVGSMNVTFRLTNNGPSAVYNHEFGVKFDGETQYKKRIAALPPFSHYDEEVKVPVSFFGDSAPKTVSVEVDGVESQVATDAHRFTLTGLTVVLAVLTLFSGIIAFGILKKYLKKKRKK